MSRRRKFKTGDYALIPERVHSGADNTIWVVESVSKKRVVLKGFHDPDPGWRHRPFYWRHVDLEFATEEDYLAQEMLKELSR
jgi:hypothetical protein